jgi:hypothetical protein
MEFYHTARQLREDITNMLLRDFGVRDKIRRERTTENIELTIIEEYPAWLITYFRTNILTALFNLTQNITAANTIYPVNEDELRIRRQYQTDAVINCEQLLNEMQFCADVLPVKLEKFLPFVEKIDFEIALLKGWRKSNNHIHKKLIKTGGKKTENPMG